MSFPRAKRFIDNFELKPSPAAYYISSELDTRYGYIPKSEINKSEWLGISPNCDKKISSSPFQLRRTSIWGPSGGGSPPAKNPQTVETPRESLTASNNSLLELKNEILKLEKDHHNKKVKHTRKKESKRNTNVITASSSDEDSEENKNNAIKALKKQIILLECQKNREKRKLESLRKQKEKLENAEKVKQFVPKVNEKPQLELYETKRQNGLKLLKKIIQQEQQKENTKSNDDVSIFECKKLLQDIKKYLSSECEKNKKHDFEKTLSGDNATISINFEEDLERLKKLFREELQFLQNSVAENAVKMIRDVKLLSGRAENRLFHECETVKKIWDLKLKTQNVHNTVYPAEKRSETFKKFYCFPEAHEFGDIDDLWDYKYDIFDFSAPSYGHNVVYNEFVDEITEAYHKEIEENKQLIDTLKAETDANDLQDSLEEITIRQRFANL